VIAAIRNGITAIAMLPLVVLSAFGQTALKAAPALATPAVSFPGTGRWSGQGWTLAASLSYPSGAPVARAAAPYEPQPDRRVAQVNAGWFLIRPPIDCAMIVGVFTVARLALGRAEETASSLGDCAGATANIRKAQSLWDDMTTKDRPTANRALFEAFFDAEAPINKWYPTHAFDTAAACERARAQAPRQNPSLEKQLAQEIAEMTGETLQRVSGYVVIQTLARCVPGSVLYAPGTR